MKEGLDGYWIGWIEGRVGWTLVRMKYSWAWMDTG